MTSTGLTQQPRLEPSVARARRGRNGNNTKQIDSLAARGLSFADLAASNVDVSADFKFDTTSGVVGLLLKYIDDANRITAYFEGVLRRLAKTDGGTLTNIAIDAAYTRSVGATAVLRVTYVDGVVTTYIDDMQMQAAILVGADLTKFGPVGMRQNEHNAHIPTLR